MRRPEFEVVLRRRVGESVYARKTRTYMILPLISMGILKTNSSVLRLGDGRRKGFKHQNVGAKNSSVDLYGEINKQTKVYYTQKATAKILPLSFIGVMPRFLFIETILKVP